MIKILVEANSFIDAIDFYGNSVLYYAIKAQNMDLSWVSLVVFDEEQMFTVPQRKHFNYVVFNDKENIHDCMQDRIY
jgi:hypothetical protein